MKIKNIKTGWAALNFWSLNDQMKSEYNATFVREIDATQLDLMRSTAFKNHGYKPSYTALIVEAAAQVLREFPIANRRIFKFGPFTKMVEFENIDVTVAIEKELEGAEAVVLAHTIRNCETMNSIEITSDLKDALNKESERWIRFSHSLGTLPPILGKLLLKMAQWLPSKWVVQRGGACFVNSPAKYGVDLVIADMLWPLTFSFGEIKMRPFVVGNSLEVRRTVPLIMIFDRRIMQGAIAARIFRRFCDLVEQNKSIPLAGVRSYESHSGDHVSK